MRRAYIVTGLGYGDEGKGRAVDYIARQSQADLVVLFNGGGQRGHNVVIPAGVSVAPDINGDPGHAHSNLGGEVHHEFRQFGSASFVPGVRTHISSFCVLDPELLFKEAEDLMAKTGEFMFPRLSIDSRAPIVTPFHRAANRVREMALRHGSTGMGIWEAERDRRQGGPTIRLGDVVGRGRMDVVAQLREIQGAKLVASQEWLDKIGAGHIHAQPFRYGTQDLMDLAETYQILADMADVRVGMPDFQVAVFEGSQGVLLDEHVGWHPHTTGSTTTSANARYLIATEVGRPTDVTHIGVTRAYSTRHGNGPFVAESVEVDFSEPHNGTGEWQGRWRQGYTDLVALQYAAQADDFDCVFLTHMDTLESVRSWQMVVEYAGLEEHDIDLYPPVSRKWQAKLGEAMWEAQPVWMDTNPSMVPEAIASATGRPVSLVSYGPTHADVDQMMPIGAAA